MTRHGIRFQLLALGIGWTALMTLLPSAVNAQDGCGIEGPTTVNEGESFQLCAPSGNRGYDWNGPGIRGDDDERCLRVRGMDEGTYRYELKIRVSRWEVQRCTYTVRVVRDAGGAGEDCLITGPARIAPNQPFMLCGPEGAGFSWSWSGGSGLPSNDSTRCVSVNGLVAGHYVFTLDVTSNGTRSTCRHVVDVEEGADEFCMISGPSTIGPNEPFELCGPSGAGYTYGWSGTGAPSDSNSRCLSFTGLARGTHEFTLRLGGPQGTRFCTFTVRVRDRDGGGFGFGCPRPLSFWRNLCDRERGDDRDRDKDGWSPATYDGDRGSRWGSISRADLARILDCLDEHSEVFNWDNDERRLCSLFDSRDWRDRGPRRELRQELAVLLLNHCAGELGILDANGHPIGSGFDPLDPISCRGFQADNLDDLLGQIDDLFGARNRLVALEHGSTRRERERRLERWTECLENLNRGGRECYDRRDRDDHDDDLVAGSLDAGPVTGAGVVLERPMPNPFATSTRLHFAVERDGTPVSIGVYDIAGRMVQRLANENRNAGLHEIQWNGMDTEGSRVHPGVYFVRGTIGTRPLSVRVMYLQ